MQSRGWTKEMGPCVPRRSVFPLAKSPMQGTSPVTKRVVAFVRLAGLLAVVVGLLVGCGSRQQGFSSWRPGDTDYLVRSIHIDGAEEIDIELLRAAIATKTLTLNPFGQNRFLNRYDLMTDVQRIETFYRMKGFFEARVTGPAEVEYFEDARRATVRYRVEEGTPSVVSEFRIVDARPAGDGVGGHAQTQSFEQLIQRMGRRLPLRNGRVYDYDLMISSGALIRRRLQELGYARAKVEARAYVSEAEHRVIVVYRVDPGHVCVFGDVLVEGNRRMPERIVKETAKLERGSDFRPSRIELARSRLYSMNAFQIVDISTALDAEGDDVGTESDPQSALSASTLARALESSESLYDDASLEGWRAVEERWLYAPRTLDAVAANSAWDRPWLDLRQTPGWIFDATSTAFLDEGYVPGLMAAFSYEGLDTRVAQLPIDFSQLDVANPYVDVNIRLVEMPAAGYRFGFGAEVDSGRWVAFLRANAIWRDVFGPLNTFETDLRLGYAWLPTPFFRTLDALDVSNRGLIAKGTLRYTRPGLIARTWNFHTALTMEKNVELIYDLLRFGGDLGFDRRWGYHYRLELSYNIDFSQETSALDKSRDAYRLAWLSANFSADHRDSTMQPRRGFYGELATELGDPFGGEFLFLQVKPDLRAYFPLSRKLTLAVRGSFGWIFNFPSSERLPANHRLYEGGATSFRGVPYRRLSPHQFRVQDNDPATPDRTVFSSSSQCLDEIGQLGGQNPSREYACRAEPVGGVFSSVISIEPRYEIGKDWLFGALFLDAGTVQTEPLPTFKLDENFWHLALGAGLRISTPLGPIRMDLAYRFTNADAFSNINRLVFFLAIGEAF